MEVLRNGGNAMILHFIMAVVFFGLKIATNENRIEKVTTILFGE